jgi:uncharacterized protein (TIGR02678 family)
VTGPTADEARALERRRALRALLARPLLLAGRDAESFPAVVRHRAELARWFAENAGWALLVDAGAGHARLMKRPARPDPTRPARAPGKGPFDRRRYALLCLALAALDREPRQVTLARLAGAVRELSAEDGGLRPFDPDLAAERRAFVDVVLLLCDLGVLVLRDGDAEQYARSREGDALYDVRERLLSQLVAAPRPPALAGTPQRMREEERGETEEGLRIRARHEIFRRLLDDPVVYLGDLDERARAWLAAGSGFVYERLLRDAGLQVERRREGLAAVDPEGTLSDTAFPEGSSTVKHAALLLCEWLADRSRPAEGEGAGQGPVATWEEIAARVEALREEHAGRWSREYEDRETGATALAEAALRVLVGFGLAAPAAGGFVALPAAARFSPAPAGP